MLDDKTGVLAIAKEVPFTESRLSDDSALITDVRLDAAEYRFTDTDLQAAIMEFVAAKGQQRIVVADSLKRFAPDNRIEQAKVEESGRKFAIDGLDNGTAAVLALAFYAQRQRDIGGAMSMLDDLASLYAIQTI